MSAERNLTSQIITLVQSRVVRPVLFVFADFPSGAYRLWTGQGDISWNSQTWTGVGEVIGFETFSESTDTAAKGITARMNVNDATVLSDLLNDDYQGSELTINLGFFESDESTLQVLPDPLWKGFLDSDEVEDDGESGSLIIRGEHRLSDILRKREFHYSEQDQKLLNPGTTDTGLNKIALIQDRQYPWGAE